MEMLSATKSRYVRCIKPNDIGEPRLMDQRKTIEQLRCAGIVATVKLSRALYPNSMKNSVLRYRYDALWDKHAFPPKSKRVAKAELRYKIECEALLACALRTLEVAMPGKTILPYVVGRTRTYFKSGALEYLESRRVLTLDNVAIVIQRFSRGFLTRKRQILIMKTIPVIQRWYRKVSVTRKKTVTYQRRQFLETRRIFERHRSPLLINRPLF
jgi:myosin-5